MGEGVANQDQRAAKKQEVIPLKVKLDSHGSGFTENSGKSDTVTRS